MNNGFKARGRGASDRRLPQLPPPPRPTACRAWITAIRPYVSQQPIRGHSVAQATPQRVYENGKLIGQDPDANVRMMMRKDFSFE